jgi:hypothetical protein
MLTLYTVAESRSLGTTAADQDFLVADAVLRNESPQSEFPANREKSREFTPFYTYFVKTRVGTLRFFNWLYTNSLGG